MRPRRKLWLAALVALAAALVAPPAAKASRRQPGFILNPTSCDPMQVSSLLGGTGADPFNPADDTTATSSEVGPNRAIRRKAGEEAGGIA